MDDAVVIDYVPLTLDDVRCLQAGLVSLAENGYRGLSLSQHVAAMSKLLEADCRLTSMWDAIRDDASVEGR